MLAAVVSAVPVLLCQRMNDHFRCDAESLRNAILEFPVWRMALRKDQRRNEGTGWEIFDYWSFLRWHSNTGTSDTTAASTIDQVAGSWVESGNFSALAVRTRRFFFLISLLRCYTLKKAGVYNERRLTVSRVNAMVGSLGWMRSKSESWCYLYLTHLRLGQTSNSKKTPKK